VKSPFDGALADALEDFVGHASGEHVLAKRQAMDEPEHPQTAR
jgi:hypothetical protein